MFVIVQVTALTGALVFGALQSRLGGRLCYALTLLLWIVAILAIEGRSNKQIAYELGFAEATVSNLLRSAAAKVGARTRVELVGVLAALERTAEGRE